MAYTSSTRSLMKVRDSQADITQIKAETEIIQSTIDETNKEIRELIRKTTVIKDDGSTVGISDAFNSLKSNVDSTNRTIKEYEIILDRQTGEITDVKNKQSEFEQSLEGFSQKVEKAENDITTVTELAQNAGGWKFIAGVTGMYNKLDEWEQTTPDELNKETVVTIDLSGITIQSDKQVNGAVTVIDELGLYGYIKRGANVDPELVFQAGERMYANRILLDNGVDFGTIKGVPRAHTQSNNNIVKTFDFIKSGGTS